jgi:hypothetical protein
MKSRGVAIMAAAGAVCAVGALVSGPSALAAPPPSTAVTCSSGQVCVWSGTNYTGQLALVPQDSWHGCVTAAELGLPAVRSAKRNGVGCHLQASLHSDGVCGQSTSPDYVQNQTPTISPAALSLDLFMIPC